MKERPILFNGAMVRAILAGTKTQTRRIFTAKNGGVWPHKNDLPGMRQILRNCPFGQPGDRLWVRECFAVQPDLWNASHGPQPLHYLADVSDRRQIEDYTVKPSIHMPRRASRITLEITGVRVERLHEISEADARAEGIESLTYGDQTTYRDYSLDDEWAAVSPMLASPKQSYRTFWERINGPGSWDVNPWVWVIEFKKLEGGET